MEAVGLNERPSDARRRLSAVMDTNVVESTLEVARRRSSVSFTKEVDVDIQESAQETSSRRVSVAARRASTFSRVFALSSVSESFVVEKLRPTLINAMLFFKDPKPNPNKLRTVLAERLLCIPRFRSVVRMDDEGVHFDPIPREDVDFEEHLKVIDGKREFVDNDIEQLVSDSFLTDWPATLPLWRMTLVQNLKDGRSMLFIVIDHSIGDGVSLLSLCLSLFDDPDEKSINSKPMSDSITKPKTKGKSLTWSHSAVAFLGGIYDGIINTLNPPTDTVSGLMIPKDELELDCPGKGLAQTRAIPVTEVKALKDKLAGATLNDVVIAVITMAIRKYFEKTGDGALDVVLKGKGKIRGDFPVNMRRGNEGAIEASNNFVVASFQFPLDYSDPIDAVWQCKARVDELKVSPSFALRKVLGDALFGKAPDTVLAPKVLEMMNRSTCMISNVKGPTETSKLGGYEIDDLNFTASFLGSLYFGILTYGGNLRVSMILDDRTGADVKELRDCFESAYVELKDSLKDVDATKPLQMPDMTPLSARILVFLVYSAAIVVPVMIAKKLQN